MVQVPQSVGLLVPGATHEAPACSLLTSDVIEPSATNFARCCYDGQKPGPLENKILSCVCPAQGGLHLSRIAAFLVLAVIIVSLIALTPQRAGRHPGKVELTS